MAGVWGIRCVWMEATSKVGWDEVKKLWGWESWANGGHIKSLKRSGGTGCTCSWMLWFWEGQASGLQLGGLFPVATNTRQHRRPAGCLGAGRKCPLQPWKNITLCIVGGWPGPWVARGEAEPDIPEQRGSNTLPGGQSPKLQGCWSCAFLILPLLQNAGSFSYLLKISL